MGFTQIFDEAIRNLDFILQSMQNRTALNNSSRTINQMDKIGKYEVVRELGSGATSTVYLANDPFSKQPVAIKLINLKALSDPHRSKIFRKLLMTEASLAGKLSHPHIVKILDAVMEEDINYVVMEYVEGSTLEKYAEVENVLPISTVAEITYKCCKALEYAQNQGVIHRDIKPANILLQGETDIKIADFGAAVIQTDRTATQIVGIGSPAYMSPEQVEESELNHQTDIYSLGVVMYKLLTGKLPFDTDSHVSTVYHILNVDPPPPSSLRREVPPEMDAIIRRAMEKKTSKRYQTWYEFSRDLVVFFKQAVPEQTEIFDTEKFDTMRSLEFFKNFSDVELWDVLRISKWRKASDSEQILHEGDSGRSFYVLAHGTVRVVKQGKWLCLLHRGDCFGEMAHLADQDFRRSADVIAKHDVLLIEISPEALASASTGCRYQFVDAFLHILVKRLTAANTRISFLEAE